MGPPQMLLNHMAFDQYHLFRSESRVLSGDEERAAGVAPDATLPTHNADRNPCSPTKSSLTQPSRRRPLTARRLRRQPCSPRPLPNPPRSAPPSQPRCPIDQSAHPVQPRASKQAHA